MDPKDADKIAKLIIKNGIEAIDIVRTTPIGFDEPKIEVIFHRKETIKVTT